MDFINTPEIQVQKKIDKGINVSTAQRWMKKVDYWWTKTGLKGQYVDGHEHKDIVTYHQNIFYQA